MDEHRLPLRAYKILLNLDRKGKTNWVTNVRKTLCVNGFSYVWDNQGVGCLHLLGSSDKDLLTCDGKLGMTM